MSQFIFIDHSLKRIGGHHFDYAYHVLTAAESAGFEVVLAAHRRFRRSSEQVPLSWVVHAPFRFDTYQPYTVFDGKSAATSENERRQWWRKFQRAKIVSSFHGSCRRLFSKVSLNEGDHVFLATLSELDLLGLAAFLKSDHRSRAVDWHLQFHFNIFEGRDPDYGQQHGRLEIVKSQFQSALGKLSQHRLHFYNTSEPLSDQYNRLGVAKFEPLAYPVNPEFAKPRVAKEPGRPLRITCAGAIRAEKGHSRLDHLVQSLWHGCLDSGKAQLVVQSKRSHMSDAPRLQIKSPSERKATAKFSSPTEADSSEPVVYVRQPLSTSEYVDFVRAADIGLMLYDSNRYYARRAGVLGEFLAAGIPVIVPAGCWLAEQIAESGFQHLDRAPQALETIGCDALPSLSFVDASAPHVENLSVPPSTRELLVSFNIHGADSMKGNYARLEVFQIDAAGCLLHRTPQIIGRRASGGPSRALFHLHPNVAQVRFNWRNAYHHGWLTVDNVEATFFRRHEDTANHPSSAVGLIAADSGEVPGLIREMIAHYDHYRKTAAEFSREWFRRHDPAATVAQLVGKQPNQVKSHIEHEAA